MISSLLKRDFGNTLILVFGGHISPSVQASVRMNFNEKNSERTRFEARMCLFRIVETKFNT